MHLKYVTTADEMNGNRKPFLFSSAIAASKAKHSIHSSGTAVTFDTAAAAAVAAAAARPVSGTLSCSRLNKSYNSSGSFLSLETISSI